MTQAFLAIPATTIQTWAVPANWQNGSNTVEAIGPGGNGSAAQTAGTTGGNGGGGGEYVKRSNVNLNPGGTAYYLLSAGGSALDSWFDDRNLELQSNTFSGASWTNQQATATTGFAAPDGTQTAWHLTEDTSVTIRHIIYTQVTPWVVAAGFTILSIYAKASQRTRLLLSLGGNNGCNCTFDLAGGQIGIAPASFGTGISGVTGNIVAIGNGWYRCWVSCTGFVSGDNFTGFQLDAGSGTGAANLVYTGDGVSGVLIWRAQLNYGTYLKPYTDNTSSTTAVYSVLAKAATNATTGAVGVHQTGGQGDVVNEGGDGFSPAASTVQGGGGGGAGGPHGAGSTATSVNGGNADSGTTVGALVNQSGVSGSQFASGFGSGSGAGGGGIGTNLPGQQGGYWGGGASGGNSGAGSVGGTGGQSLIILNYFGDVIREVVRGGKKTQVVQLDLGGVVGNSETLIRPGQTGMKTSAPVAISSPLDGPMKTLRTWANSAILNLKAPN